MGKNAILYMHGYGGSAGEAEHYKQLLPQYDIFGLDYKGDTPWDTKDEIIGAYDDLKGEYDTISLIANSIGAYFSMNALSDRKIERAMMISPIVNMPRLIFDMMAFNNVTEEKLKSSDTITIPSGQVISWEYLSYARDNPIVWNAPTYVLYGQTDNFTSRATMEEFCSSIGAEITVMENGEHWFHTQEQMNFLDKWIKSIN